MFSVWISELAARSGASVATIKYYLREGLLPPGEATGATRAKYDDRHVARLKLVRALTEVAGMRLEQVRAVLEAMDDDSRSWHDAVGSAHRRLPPPTAAEPDPESAQRVQELLDRHGWELEPDSPHRATLAGALRSLAELGHSPCDEVLDVYAEAAATIAEHDVASIEAKDPTAATEHIVVSTLLLEPVLLTLRRIAQQNVSRRLS